METCNFDSSVDKLPMEILLKIFEYLSFSDLQSAGATCKKWRSALFENKFNRRAVAHFVKVNLSDNYHPASNVISCDRPIENIYFEDVSFGEVHCFFTHLAESVTNFGLEDTDLIQKNFWPLIANFKKLKSLTIVNCSQLFMFSSYAESFEEYYHVLADVTSLSLPNNQYLTDALLNRFTTPIKKLVSLDLSGCHIAYHYAIQRRFYPANCTEKPSDSILTYLFILKLLKQHKNHITDLNFSNTSISITALRALTDMEDGSLQLRKLWLSNCRQLNCNFSNFLKNQHSLVVLDLSNTMSVDDTCIDIIINNLTLIEELNIKGSNLITNNGAIALKNLKKLRTLNISRCLNIKTEGIIYGIASEPNNILQELDMSGLTVFPEAIKAVSLNLKELIILNLSSCVHGVNDESVQNVIEHLVKLHELYLEGCYSITDAALTGINLSTFGLDMENEINRSANSMAGSVDTLGSPPPLLNMVDLGLRISLRSKAEEEIVKDANRKKAILKAYELSLVNSHVVEGFSIENLKGLRVLNISNCNKITDVSLKYGLKFLELKSLSLSRCQQISFIGMESLTSNTPSIEEINLTDCYNINDKAIKILTTKLKRLKVLHISGCTQLTDHSLDAIIVNCKNLQTLSVHRCRQMYTDIEERLSNLTSLRNIYMDNATNIDNAELLRFKKRFDY